MQIPDKDRLDSWLNAALRQQMDTEPRTGLEGRILANLHSRERTREIRWALVLGGPVLAVLLIALLWRGERVNVNAPGLIARNGAVQSLPVEQVLAPNPQVLLSGTHDSEPVRAIEHHASVHAHHSEPRLEHFPSARPLSAQEIAMARYAARYPEQAALMAKEQQDFDKQIQKAEQESEAQSGISNE